MGGKVGWGSDGVGSNVVTPDKQGGLTCVEEHAVRTCVGKHASPDSVARDSGVPHIEHIHNDYTSSISHWHSKAMDFPPCTRPVDFNLLVSNKLH